MIPMDSLLKKRINTLDYYYASVFIIKKHSENINNLDHFEEKNNNYFTFYPEKKRIFHWGTEVNKYFVQLSIIWLFWTIDQKRKIRNFTSLIIYSYTRIRSNSTIPFKYYNCSPRNASFDF